MNLYRETTDWTTPNHVYLLDESKQYMHGYSILGEEPLQMFKQPIRFSTRGRTFQFVSHYAGETKENVKHIVSVQVEGSRGAEYTVILQDDSATCTCQGFQFRSDCRHLELARNQFLYL